MPDAGFKIMLDLHFAFTTIFTKDSQQTYSLSVSIFHVLVDTCKEST